MSGLYAIRRQLARDLQNPVCMRIAFNNMHKNWVSSAKAALINMGHEFWRTSGAICRITEGMDTGLFN